VAAPHPVLLSILLRNEVTADEWIDDEIVSSAIDHMVAPLLHEATVEHRLSGDAKAMQRLAVHRLRSESQHARANDALDRFVDRVGSHMRVGVFKGLALAPLLYDPPALRWATDVDVFFHSDGLGEFGPAVSRAFSDQSTSRPPDYNVPRLDLFEVERLTLAANQINQFNETRALNDVLFDIHTDIAKFGGRALRQQDVVWTRMLRVVGGDYFVPDTELAVILVVVHSGRDCFGDLRKCVDFLRLLDRDPDWEFIAAFIESEGWTRAFTIALDIMCTLVGVSLPAPFALGSLDQRLGARLWPSSMHLLGEWAPRPVLCTVLISALHEEPFWPVVRALHGLLVPLYLRKESTMQSKAASRRGVLRYWVSRLDAPFRRFSSYRAHKRSILKDHS